MASEPGQIERVEGEEFDSIAQAEHDFAISSSIYCQF
jgi:hypothetical protein